MLRNKSEARSLDPARERLRKTSLIFGSSSLLSSFHPSLSFSLFRSVPVEGRLRMSNL